MDILDRKHINQRKKNLIPNQVFLLETHRMDMSHIFYQKRPHNIFLQSQSEQSFLSLKSRQEVYSAGAL